MTANTNLNDKCFGENSGSNYRNNIVVKMVLNKYVEEKWQ